MKTMGRLLEADGGQLQQPNRLQPLEKVRIKFNLNDSLHFTNQLFPTTVEAA